MTRSPVDLRRLRCTRCGEERYVVSSHRPEKGSQFAPCEVCGGRLALLAPAPDSPAERPVDDPSIEPGADRPTRPRL